MGSARRHRLPTSADIIVQPPSPSPSPSHTASPGSARGLAAARLKLRPQAAEASGDIREASSRASLHALGCGSSDQPLGVGSGNQLLGAGSCGTGSGGTGGGGEDGGMRKVRLGICVG